MVHKPHFLLPVFGTMTINHFWHVHAIMSYPWTYICDLNHIAPSTVELFPTSCLQCVTKQLFASWWQHVLRYQQFICNFVSWICCDYDYQICLNLMNLLGGIFISLVLLKIHKIPNADLLISRDDGCDCNIWLS